MRMLLWLLLCPSVLAQSESSGQGWGNYFTGHLVDHGTGYRHQLLDLELMSTKMTFVQYATKIQTAAEQLSSNFMATVTSFQRAERPSELRVNFEIATTDGDEQFSALKLAQRIDHADANFGDTVLRVIGEGQGLIGITESLEAGDRDSSDYAYRTGDKLSTDFMLSNMNQNVEAEPCNDFADFMCSNFIEESYFDVFQRQADEIVADAITKLKSDDSILYKRVVRKAWDSCKSAYDIDFPARTEFIRETMEAFGGWPTLNISWDPSRFDLALTAANMQIYGSQEGPGRVSKLINSVKSPDAFNLENGQKYQLRAEFDKFSSISYSGYYADLSSDVASFLGQPIEFEQAARDEQELSALVGAINSLHSKHFVTDVAPSPQGEPFQNLNWLYANVKSVSELVREYGTSFNWPYYVLALSKAGLNAESVLLNGINVPFKAYSKALVELLASKPSRVVQNLFIFEYLLLNGNLVPAVKTLNKPQVELTKGWRKNSPPEKMLLRKEARLIEDDEMESIPTPAEDRITAQFRTCLESMRAEIPHALGRVYADAHFSKVVHDIRRLTRPMLNQIKAGWVQQLVSMGSLTGDTLVQTVAKVQKAYFTIGFAEFILDDDKLNEMYEELDDALLPNEDPVIAQHKISSYVLKKDLEQVERPWQIDDNGNPTFANAWHNFERNSIQMPAAILQAPFFHPHFPTVVNYGAIGVIMGHEIGHGYDPKGIYWTTAGRNELMLDNDTMAAFVESRSCLLRQFSHLCEKYHCSSSPADPFYGVGPVHQAFADQVGLKSSFNGVKMLRPKKEKKMAGALSLFTKEQLFFMAYGQVWCSYSRELMDWRNNEALQNFREFAKAFSCPTGSYMAPEDYCDVWGK